MNSVTKMLKFDKMSKTFAIPESFFFAESSLLMLRTQQIFRFIAIEFLFPKERKSVVDNYNNYQQCILINQKLKK